MRAFSTATAAVVLLFALGPTVAVACDPGRADNFQRMSRAAFNHYYFTSEDNIDRCLYLLRAIEREHSLAMALQRCDVGLADDARVRLADLVDLVEDESTCRH